MVQSIDGVGTKTIIARKLGKFDTIGVDLLSAAANDILVMGARPLTFLDYIANDKLNPEIIEEIVSGMVKACKSTGVSLVGGETGGFILEVLPKNIDIIKSVFLNYGLDVFDIGSTGRESIEINGITNIYVNEVKKAWTNGLREKL